MSTQPAYDPDPQVDGPTGARGVRCLVDEVVRTAAPRLGKTAVARIAGPITEGVIAWRDEHARRVDDLEHYVVKLARGLGITVDMDALRTDEGLHLIGEAALTVLESRQRTYDAVDLLDAMSHVVSMWRPRDGAARTVLAERRLDGLAHRLDNVVVEWDRLERSAQVPPLPELGEVIASNERLAQLVRTDGVVIFSAAANALLVSERGEWYMPGAPTVAHPDLSVRWVVERVPGGTS